MPARRVVDIGFRPFGCLLLAAIAAGCPSGNSGAKDAGTDAGKKDAAVGAVGGGSSAGSSGGSTGGTSGGAGGSRGSGGSGGSSSGPLASPDAGPAAIHLDGTWNDNGRHVIILQDGLHVTGTYHTPYVCDPNSGAQPEGTAPGPDSETTTEDFTATLDNGPDVHVMDTLSGSTSTCRHGYDVDSGLMNGIVLSDLHLTVTDADTLTGTWTSDNNGDGKPDAEGSVLMTRQQ